MKIFFRHLLGRLDRYLNGTINFNLLKHPAVRWSLIALTVLYIVLGVIVGLKIYKTKTESTNIRRILTIYPFPAVLMPQDVILVSDYLNQLKFIRHFADKTKKALPSDTDLRAQLIGQIIETRMLLRVTRQYRANVTRADIDAAYKKIAEANGGQKEVNNLLRDLYGMTEREFRQLIRDQLLREKVQQQILTRIQAKHILIKDQQKAQGILDQLKKEGAKFDALAKENSEDTATRDKGGDLGFFGRGVMAKAFEDVAFKLKKGEMSPALVKTDFGYHIIMVVNRTGRVDMTYTDYLQSLGKEMKAWTVFK